MIVYEFGPFRLDAEHLLLFVDGVPAALGPKVVETLLALVERPGEVLAKSALLDRIWPEGYVDEANLAQNVYVLRRAMRTHWNAGAIETVPRRGYRFAAPVRAVDARPSVSRRSFWKPLAAAAAFVVLLGSASALIPLHRDAGAALSPEAARLYDIGHYYWNLRTRDGIRKSMQYFSLVVQDDPSSARGYAALASSNAMMADYEYGPESSHAYAERARAYAHRALAIDPNCAQAYAVLGMLSGLQGLSGSRLAKSDAELRRAIALDPENGSSHEWYGINLLQHGRVREAYRELLRAAELDPLSVATAAWLGNAAYLDRRYDQAIAYAREALDLSPQWNDGYETLGLAYEARGDDARAVDAFTRFARVCRRCGPQAAALLAYIYARTNREAAARAELNIAQAHAAEVSPDAMAAAFDALGRRRGALSWLRRAHGGYVQAELANDPRFAALRGRIGPQEKPA